MSSSCWCAFCDKEMLSESLSIICQGYITCGSATCEGRAKANANAIAKEALVKEVHKSRMVVFSTLTPEDDDTWRLVPRIEHPVALSNIDVMSHMKIGHYVLDDETGLYYCSKTSNDVIRETQKSAEQL